MSRPQRVERPLKRAEYEIVFLTRNARQGRQDCLAVARNATVDAWDCLTTTPMRESDRLYRLKGDYATGTFQGGAFERYQYKITNGGRLWYFVQAAPDAEAAGRVLLERCETGHPKETERK